MIFYITFNKNEYKTEDNIRILESIKGVKKDDENDCFITFNDFKQMELFCLELEKKTRYKATVIISFDPPELFIHMENNI